MKRLAIFVEGQTEHVFVSQLINEIAGEKRAFVAIEKWKKNKAGERIFTAIDVTKVPTDEKYYVLIRDCGSDSCVKSDIRESCEKLAQTGYEKIIGLRDVYPRSAADIPNLRKYLSYGMPMRFIPIHLVLAVMEVESWFLAEVSHFKKIDPRLTLSLISSILMFDPSIEDVESRHHPSQDLDNIYSVAGLRYSKKKRSVQRTVNAIDYSVLYIELSKRIKSLEEFIGHIDAFLT